MKTNKGRVSVLLLFVILGLVGCLFISKNERDPLAWDYYWMASELPEEYQSGTVLETSMWGPVVRRAEDGNYWCEVKPNGGCFYYTKSSILDPGLPSTIEFRIKVQDTHAPHGISVILRQKGIGALGFSFEGDNRVEVLMDDSVYAVPYCDEEGWTTFRIITSVNNRMLQRAELYYRDAEDRWVQAITANIIDELMAAQESAIVVGVLGADWGGTWSEDYLCWTQGTSSLE